jgi:hypothetical protein
MSELTLTESEVLTDNTDVICSTSIERIVTDATRRWLKLKR